MISQIKHITRHSEHRQIGKNKSGKFSILILLDLSAAFDTVHHSILCWMAQYWTRPGHIYKTGTTLSPLVTMYLNQLTLRVEVVPKGTILSLSLFNLDMIPLQLIIRNNNIAYHRYGDDTQIFLALSPTDVSSYRSAVSLGRSRTGCARMSYN